MYTNTQIKEFVQQNINQIKISEFVADGGWPIIDNIDVTIYKQTEEKGIETISLDILYEVHKTGCCFIPGSDLPMRLSKIVTIEDNQIKFK